jgi:ribosome maturation factor RimP
MLKEQIEKLVHDNLESEQHFLVDIVISGQKGPKKVLILLDGDEGINIDDCAKISRKVGLIIEEEQIIEDAYRLEVSSPGLDHPIVLLRQYVKNIGRNVRITTNEGQQYEGILIDANETEVHIEEEKGKGSKKEVNEVTFPFDQIKKTEILVKF